MSEVQVDGTGPIDTVSTVFSQDRLPKWFWRAVVAIAVSVAGFLLLRGAVTKLRDLIVMLGIALFLSFAVEPATNFLVDRGWRRGRATLFCFVAIFVVGGVFFTVMIGLVVTQLSELAGKAPGYVRDVATWLNDQFGTEITTTKLNKALNDYQSDLAGVATNVGGRVLSLTTSVVGITFQAFTVALFSYYMIAQGPQLRRNVCSVLPTERQQLVLRIWELAIDKTGGWIYSRVVLAFFSSASSWVVFAVMGVPSPLALALWVGLVSQFIPVIGTYLAGALPILIALLNDPWDAVVVLIWIVVYQQVENYLLSPKITATTMNLHPAVSFGSAIAGAMLLGPMGAIVALPIAAVVTAVVSTYLERHEVVESELTELDEIEEAQGDSAVRKALRRMGAGKGIDDLVAEAEGAAPPPAEADPEPGAEVDPEP
ncbi:MAG: AI-2E family transporter [Actinomycetes bacterium]